MDLRKKLLGLAGAAVVFAGMANAQLTCTTLSGSATFIRSESQNDALPQLTLGTCNAAPVAGSIANVTVFLAPSVAITSPASGQAVSVTAPSGSTEAQLTVAGAPAVYYGIVTGSSVTFSSVSVPPGTTPTFLINNIRVNGSSIPSVVGSAPTAINAQAFISGTNVTPGPTNSLAAAYTLNGLAVSKITKDAAQATSGSNVGSPFGVCGNINAGNAGTAVTSFFVNANENYATAFKTKASESTGVGIDPTLINSGTRIKVVFSNVPSGLNVFGALTVTATDGAVLTAQIGETASTNGTANNATAVTSPSSVAGLAAGWTQATGSGGTLTLVYEVTTDNPGTDIFSIPVILNASTNAVVNQSSTMTVQTSLAPVTGTSTIPSFVVGTSSSSTNVLSFTLCSTTLLFPFVTNQAGFETGIAIANTSTDPFGSAKPQSGTCTLNYYGTGGTNPTKTTAPNTNEASGSPYLSGETYAFTLTNALAATTGNPATFQGYIIAACNFQFAHGFAYITYAFPGASSDTMGYLALSIPRGATGPESAGH